jgi:gliding-associated putative ABC transporter substrate-binding component GldG
MKKNSYLTSILLLIAIFVVVAAISEKFFFRLDLTEGGQYSLSKATKNILKNLDTPVTVKAYFTSDLNPDLAKVKNNFQDLLIEFNSLSGGKVVYEFSNPNEKAEIETEALQAGIQPVLLNTREKDEVKQQKVFMGAVVSIGNDKEVIPFIDPNSSIEYSLSTAIKKLSVTNKPKIGFVQGQGEPPPGAYPQAMEQLTVLYDVSPVYLSDSVRNINQYKALIISAPQDTFDIAKLNIIDDYLSAGGKLFIAMNQVDGDLQTLRGSAKNTGLSDWLLQKGLKIDDAFVVDANCGTIGVSQQTSFGTMTSQVKFPYIPVIRNFSSHPATKGLEQVIMAFCSPVSYVGDTNTTFTPLAFTSDQSGVENTPVFFDINKQWTQSDFNAGRQAVA